MYVNLFTVVSSTLALTSLRLCLCCQSLLLNLKSAQQITSPFTDIVPTLLRQEAEDPLQNCASTVVARCPASTHLQNLAMSAPNTEDFGPATLKNSTLLEPETESETIARLQNENQTLQRRVLGVNELARLLQDKTDLVQVLQEKNKRLEVAVVRLENRCSNFERKMKTLTSSGVTAKPGQSPFIPGPSRQILEALMKENTDLKKALNNVTEKKGSGYMEAVVSGRNGRGREK